MSEIATSNATMPEYCPYWYDYAEELYDINGIIGLCPLQRKRPQNWERLKREIAEGRLGEGDRAPWPVVDKLDSEG